MDDSEDHPANGPRFDPLTDTYHASWDPTTDEPLAFAIIETVSAISGNEPTSIQPMYDVLDPDALESIFTRASSDVSVSFTLDGYPIVVHAGGEIVVDVSGVDD